MPRTGTGRVFQRGDTWWIDYSFRGKRYRESSESTKRAAATKLLKQRLAEMGAGRISRDEERVTFEDLATMIKTDYEVNYRRSIGGMLRSFKHLRGYFGSYRAIDITTDRINAYIAHRQAEEGANATIQLELSALKRAFTLAVQAQRLSGRPYIPSVKVSNTREGFFELGDFENVVRQLAPALRLVAWFGYHTGWRKNEILPLTWAAVDFDAGTVRLAPGSTKNDDGREFPFRALPPLEAMLRDQREATRVLERAQGRIIPHVFHRNGEPIKSMDEAWEGACRRAGFEGWLFHDLRRTAVRNLERAGVSRSVAMSLTGHKTEAVYRRYAIADQRAQAEGVAKLAQLFIVPAGPTVLPITAAEG